MALFLILALAWQALLVQTHVHDELAAASIATSGHALSLRGDRSTKAPIECLLCREASVSGSFVVPVPPITLAAVGVAPVPALAAGRQQLATAQRSHAWRGRAPPVRLS